MSEETKKESEFKLNSSFPIFKLESSFPGYCFNPKSLDENANDFMKQLNDSGSRKKGLIINLPTGFGGSNVAVECMKRINVQLPSSSPCLVLVPNNILMKVWKNMFNCTYFDVRYKFNSDDHVKIDTQVETNTDTQVERKTEKKVEEKSINAYPILYILLVSHAIRNVSSLFQWNVVLYSNVSCTRLARWQPQSYHHIPIVPYMSKVDSKLIQQWSDIVGLAPMSNSEFVSKHVFEVQKSCTKEE